MQGAGSLTYVDAVILGVVQGLTEFLPVSSSAHLAVAQRWLGLDPDALSMHVFDGVSHIGTVVAVFVVFFGSFRRYLARLTAELRTLLSLRLQGESSPLSRGEAGRWRPATRFAMLGACASIPTAAIGLLFKKHFEQSFGDRIEVGVGLLITGALLVGTSLAPRGRKGWRQFRWWHAGLIGVAQGISISPGVSRSGATICTATLFGIRRRWAAEFSFFIAIPAILGATILKLREAIFEHSGLAGGVSWGPTVAGGLVAMVVGVISLKLLLDAVRRAKLHHFAWYCFAFGALVLAGLV